MNRFITNFGNEMVQLNQVLNGHNNNDNEYQPGIGPYNEDLIVDMVMANLSKNGEVDEPFFIRPNMNKKKELGLQNYVGITGRAATPDLILGNKIIEFKIARPLRDNGQPEDTWFKKVFDPHPTSYSTFIDVEKLSKFHREHDSDNKFEKWVVVIGFERENEDTYVLDALFPGLFNYIANHISKRQVIQDFGLTFNMGNRHPFHQVAKLYAFRF